MLRSLKNTIILIYLQDDYDRFAEYRRISLVPLEWIMISDFGVLGGSRLRGVLTNFLQTFCDLGLPRRVFRVEETLSTPSPPSQNVFVREYEQGAQYNMKTQGKLGP